MTSMLERTATAVHQTPVTTPTETALKRKKPHGANYRWAVLAIGFGAQAAFSVAFQGIPVAGPLMQTAYQLTTGQLGLVLSFMSLGIAVSDVVWGIVSDRIGERKVLVAGMVGLTVVLGLISAFLVPSGGQIPTIALLSLGLLVAGALGGSVNGASGRAIMAWFSKRERGFAISVRVTAVPVGGAIGAAALPFLAMNYGFRGVFVFLTVISLAATAAIYFWLDEPPVAKVAPKVKGEKRVSTVPSPLRVWNVWRVAIASGLLTCPQFVVLTFAGIYLHTAKGVGIGTIAGLLVAVQVLGAVSRVWGGRWTDRRDGRLRRTVIKWMSWITAVGFVGVAIASDAPAPVSVSLLCVSGVFACGWHGIAYAEIAEIAGAERSGTALGLENTMVFAGAFITPVLIPVILDFSGSWAVTMIVIGAVPAIIAAVLVPREGK
ncbi:MFS transporter [Amycolatopsis sp. cg5]|uniref:MFS transporter n=1 Tax=Amycolatopsis sp. cg5 TaxID=3238802 RepID=UPI00352473D1